MSDTYVLTSRQPIAEKTTEIILTPQTGARFNFSAGQYANLSLLKPKYQDDLGNSRDFSIAAAPSEAELRFAFRHSSSAFKRNVLELPLGSELCVTGPHGLMTLPEEAGSRVAMIAGGIGITPFRSIITEAAHHQSGPLTLLYANRNEASAAYLSELRQQSSAKLIEHYGPLSAEIMGELIAASKAGYYLVAGPIGFTNLAQETLTEAGIPRLNILIEQFIGYE